MLESIGFLGLGFEQLFTPGRMWWVFAGTLLGLLVGVIPGVGGTTGVAILLPVTVFLEPVSALVMLAGIYWGSMFGGVVTSVLFGVPGNPWSVAVMFDGRPMAKKGQAGLAMSAAFMVSIVGALIAAVLFTLFMVPFAGIALRFGPTEMFAVLMIAFGTFVGLGGDPFKAIIMLAAGFILSAVGLDTVSGEPRLTYDSITLLQGFHFVPITVGLFGIGEVLYNAAERHKIKIEDMMSSATLGLKNVADAFRAMLKHIWLVVSSALLGFITGILPGVGATPASFMSYGLAQKFSRNPEKFGTGAIEGVMAPEAANNAAGTGSILPMLVLGIPGSPTAAILMAGVFMWGFIPGPRLLHDAPELVWAFIASLYVANVIAFVICLTATPLLASVLKVPYALLAPIIVVLCIIGAYAIQNSMLDVMLVLVFGVFGFILRKLDYPLAPLIVALVLGAPTELTLRQSLIVSDGSMSVFFTGSLTLPLMLVAMTLFLLPLIRLAIRWLKSAVSG